jgi:SAM-dependent methyltransferase
VTSLHHADLERVLPAMAGLLRPGGLVVVSEFSWEAYDERAAAWVAEHDPARDASVAAWREEHGDLHTGERVLAALDGTFTRRSVTARPFLASMLERPELERDELAEIERDRLPALGWWWAGVRAG